MDLRRSLRKNKTDEYKDLQMSLSCMGAYEDGMDLEEMREVMAAIENSVIETCLDQDLEKALRESEMDFGSVPHDSMHNSTMINALNAVHLENAVCAIDLLNSVPMQGQRSASSSPELGPKVFTVHALVHHPMDWSPPRSRTIIEDDQQRLRRKRLLSSDISRRTNSMETDSKRSSLTDEFASSSSTSIAASTDSGINWSESSMTASSSNCNHTSTSVPSIAEDFEPRLQASSSSVAVSDYRDTSDDGEAVPNYHDDLFERSDPSI